MNPHPEVGAGSRADAPLPRRVAAFDFDGTLTRHDTLVPFLLRVAGAPRFAATSVKLGAQGLLGKVPLRDRDRVKELMIRSLLAGRSESELHRLGEAYASEILAERMNDDVLRRLREHLEQRHEVLLVSASLVYYLQPIARQLGIDAVIAVEPRVVGGVLDGSLTRPNVRAEQKAVRLNEWLRATRSDSGAGDRPVELWAYGNSSGDHELLALADHPFWLGPERKRPSGTSTFSAARLDG